MTDREAVRDTIRRARQVRAEAACACARSREIRSRIKALVAESRALLEQIRPAPPAG